MSGGSEPLSHVCGGPQHAVLPIVIDQPFCGCPCAIPLASAATIDCACLFWNDFVWAMMESSSVSTNTDCVSFLASYFAERCRKS